MIDVLRPSVAANYILPPDIPQNLKSKYDGEISSLHRLPEHLLKSAPAFFSPPRRFASNAFQNSVRLPIAFPDAAGAERELEADVSILSRPRLASLLPVAITDKEDIGVIKQILPSVVRIYAENSKKDEAWFGSGAIVDPAEIIPGYEPRENEYFILTNNHVANEADYLSVKLADGSELMGKVVKAPNGAPLMDKEMDVALIRIASPKPLPTARIGDPEKLDIGQKIFTAGYPKALPNVVVTKGIISNPAQETGSLSLDIQSDAPINPGNSGGPSFNESGEVIGMNTYTFKNAEDLTFAKPINVQLDTLRDIWRNGRIVRGALNFTVTPFPLIDRIQAGFPEEITGAVIDVVNEDSEAAKAGLQTGDLISWLEVRRDGASIASLDVNILDYFEANGVIKRWAAHLAPGSEVNATVFRKRGEIWETLDLPIEVESLN